MQKDADVSGGISVIQATYTRGFHSISNSKQVDSSHQCLFPAHSESASGSIRRGVLRLGFRFRPSLEEAEVGPGINELLDLVDPQASILIGNNMCDPDHFTDDLHSGRGTRPDSELWDRRHVKQGSVGLYFWTTNVNEDLTWGFSERMDRQLWEQFSQEQ